jgi:hypothetical protein
VGFPMLAALRAADRLSDFSAPLAGAVVGLATALVLWLLDSFELGMFPVAALIGGICGWVALRIAHKLPMHDNAATMLRAVKIVHTLAWAVFAGCIVALPVAAWGKKFFAAAVLVAVVLVEILILLANRFRCPLTDVAARYTDDRRDNFDIYLPLWLARYNKQIFGTLFAAGVLFTLLMWCGS